MAEIDENFNPKMEAAIIALIEQPTIEDAARAAQVSPRTLWRWLAREDFKRRLNEARGVVYDNSVNELKTACAVAVRTLRAVAEDASVSPSARVAASTAILSNCFKAVEQIELQTRLKTLELQILTMESEKENFYVG